MGFARHATKIKPLGKTITVASLKDLGLYSSFDVSRWCASNGLLSAYLERQTERIMEVQWVYMEEPCWKVKDAQFPAKVINKFQLRGAKDYDEVRKLGEAWMEATYGTPMKYLHVMRSSFVAPAVDIILHDLETMYRVWNLDPQIRATLTKRETHSFLDRYPQKPQSFTPADLKVSL